MARTRRPAMIDCTELNYITWRIRKRERKKTSWCLSRLAAQWTHGSERKEKERERERERKGRLLFRFCCEIVVVIVVESNGTFLPPSFSLSSLSLYLVYLAINRHWEIHKRWKCNQILVLNYNLKTTHVRVVCLCGFFCVQTHFKTSFRINLEMDSFIYLFYSSHYYLMTNYFTSLCNAYTWTCFFNLINFLLYFSLRNSLFIFLYLSVL